MNLYLLRHGEAEASVRNDSARRLTPHGREQILSVADQFLNKHLPLQRCFASPYVRAQQTAHTFLSITAETIEPQTLDLLKPEVRASEVMQFLSVQPDENVLLVSHNPLLSELNALLTEGNIGTMAILGTGQLVYVDVEIIGLAMGTCHFHLVPDARFASAYHS